ncbi:unnamed protein product [Dovyalis caffra]|uniref:Uncharacterized protein n=1 Tax=Dovyalis caffra TaxID=77055 RepID=A0AAV1S3J6_9ROSI|nr:unnamed protein product [Dovyalis caffra]
MPKQSGLKEKKVKKEEQSTMPRKGREERAVDHTNTESFEKEKKWRRKRSRCFIEEEEDDTNSIEVRTRIGSDNRGSRSEGKGKCGSGKAGKNISTPKNVEEKDEMPLRYAYERAFQRSAGDNFVFSLPKKFPNITDPFSSSEAQL